MLRLPGCKHRGCEYGTTPTSITIVRATPDWALLVYLYVQYVLCIAISHVSICTVCIVYSDITCIYVHVYCV